MSEKRTNEIAEIAKKRVVKITRILRGCKSIIIAIVKRRTLVHKTLIAII
jgi:hypothetical protein